MCPVPPRQKSPWLFGGRIRRVDIGICNTVHEGGHRHHHVFVAFILLPGFRQASQPRAYFAGNERHQRSFWVPFKMPVRESLSDSPAQSVEMLEDRRLPFDLVFLIVLRNERPREGGFLHCLVADHQKSYEK